LHVPARLLAITVWQMEWQLFHGREEEGRQLGPDNGSRPLPTPEQMATQRYIMMTV